MLTTAPYPTVAASWPATGRHILATFDDRHIIVYQAFNQAIADYAVKHQTFLGCPVYNPNRMTWVKTNFLWMQYRCGWGAKDTNQERVLALTVTRDAFDGWLRQSVASSSDGPAAARDAHREAIAASDVRLQWDPDHDPAGHPVPGRRAVQLGLRGGALAAFLAPDSRQLVRIDDVTDALVAPQRAIAAAAAQWALLNVPIERCYVPADHTVRTRIVLDDPPVSVTSGAAAPI